MSIQTYEIVEEFNGLEAVRWEIAVFQLMAVSDELIAHERAVDLREGFDVDGIETKH